MKALLLLDNCSAHPGSNMILVGGIKVLSLSEDTTSILQHRDQGYIESTRTGYVHLLLRIILHAKVM